MINKVRTYLGNMVRSKFVRSVTTVASGSAIGQLIAAVASLLIARLYTPADMGLYASCVAIAATIGVIATGKYEMAIVLPEDDRDATALAYLAMMIASICATLTLAISLIPGDSILGLVGLGGVPKGWVCFVSLFIFFAGLDAVMHRLMIRDAKFRPLAATTILQQTASNGTSIGMGFWKPGLGGLLLGNAIGEFIRHTWLFWHQRHSRHHRITVSKYAHLRKDTNVFPC